MQTQISQTWHADPAGTRQVTQFGIRLPDGKVHWGDVTRAHQPTTIETSGMAHTVFADPAAEETKESVRTIVGLRHRIGNALRGAFLAEEQVIRHVTQVTYVSRLVVIVLSETEGE
jgi:hypothetical protein